MSDGIKRIIQTIKEAEKIALFSHVSPDGDTLGSALAFKHALGGKVDLYCDSEISDYYDVLPGIELVKKHEDLKGNYPLMIALDCADPKRLGAYEKTFLAHGNTIVFDHHVTNNGFGKKNFIEHESSSTCELVLPFVSELSNGKLSKDAAVCLFVGLSTDTGNFCHSNTTARTMERAGQLLSCGIAISEITDKLYRETSINRIKLLGRAINGMSFHEDNKIAAICITLDMLKECGCMPYDTEGIVDYAINLKGVKIGMNIHETGRNCFKVSMRAKKGMNVSETAQHFGGGGHVQAAGCMIQGSYFDVLDKVLRQLKLTNEL